MSAEELRKFFDFNESDLNANRMGRLSPAQKKRLEEGEKGADKIFVGFGIFMILLALGISIFANWGLFRNGNPDLSSIDAPELLLLTVGLPWVVCGFFAYGSFKLASKKPDNSVQSVEGKVNFVRVDSTVSERTASGNSTTREVQQYELRVGRVKFEDVDEEMLNIIEEGDSYAFYYTRGDKEILSAEFVKKKD